MKPFPTPARQDVKVKRIQNLRRLLFRVFRCCWFALFVGAMFYAPVALYRDLCRLSPLLFLTAPKFAFGLSLNVLSLVVVLLCLFRRRFFCKTLCPLGAAVDAAAWTRRKLFKKRLLKYGLVFSPRYGVAFFGVLWLASFVGLWTSSAVGWSPAAFDPTALMTRWLTKFPRSGYVALTFLVCFIAAPYFWRWNFCPCGLLQEALYLPYRTIRRCLHTKKERANQETVKAPLKNQRRRFFAVLGSMGVASVLFTCLRRAALSLETRFFRPPGALPEAEFLARCVRCGRCVDVCPTKLLTPIQLDDDHKTPPPSLRGVLERDTPQVAFRGNYCEENCVACAQACPSGAIKSLTLEDKKNSPIALVEFSLERCLLYYDRECSICRRECPYEAIDFKWSDDAYANVPTIDVDRCVGCGRCVAFCPGEPLVDALGKIIEDAKQPNSVERTKALTLTFRQ